MVTKEWAAIHRKHHAKCETVDDPHSPVTRGIKAVLLTGAEMYRAESKNKETIAKFGHGTPDDWIERNLYSRFQWQGVALMMIINLVLFGAAGATIWAVQMLWIPITAAGIINGIGHYWGYRNFEAVDASRNIMPWGIIIGGEELHNNHHTYPTSAKLSVKPYEFDIAWGYIRAMEMIGWAKVRKVAPQMKTGEVRAVADSETLEAIIANRYEVMAKYARELRRACAAELAALQEPRAPSTPPQAPTCASRAAGCTATSRRSRATCRPRSPTPPPRPRSSASWWRCAKSCARCGRARTCRPSRPSPTCRPGASRPRNRASRRCASSRSSCAPPRPPEPSPLRFARPASAGFVVPGPGVRAARRGPLHGSSAKSAVGAGFPGARRKRRFAPRSRAPIVHTSEHETPPNQPTRHQEPTMTKTTTQAAALVLSALMSLAVVAGMNGIATKQYAAADSWPWRPTARPTSRCST